MPLQMHQTVNPVHLLQNYNTISYTNRLCGSPVVTPRKVIKIKSLLDLVVYKNGLLEPKFKQDSLMLVIMQVSVFRQRVGVRA